MPAWKLDYSDLTPAQREHIAKAADYYTCECTDGDAGQATLDIFNAVVEVIQMRDQAEIRATLSSG